MTTTTNSASLSSTTVCSQTSAATVCALPAQDFGWRSEAFPEDLQADAAFNSRVGLPHVTHSRWHIALQCALPLAVAAAGGIVVYLNTLA